MEVGGPKRRKTASFEQDSGEKPELQRSGPGPESRPEDPRINSERPRTRRSQCEEHEKGKDSRSRNKIPKKDTPIGGRRGGGDRGQDGGRPQPDRGGGGGDNTKGLNFIYLNAQSILSKVTDLEATASIIKPDLILVTESWCNSNISDNVLKISNYELVSELRKDRHDTTNGIGGGLLVYSRKGLEVLPCDKYNNFNQYVSFKVSCNNSIINVFLVYRPPNCLKENCDKLIEILENAPNNSILIGDFNYPGVDWDNLTSDNKSLTFLNTCIDKNFSQYVDFPTHSRNNILDLVLSNNDNIVNVENLGPLSNSDHVMLLITTNFYVKNEVNSYVRYDWKNADFLKMENEMKNIDWEREINNVHDGWNKLKSVIDNVTEKYVPKVIIKNDAQKPLWMNSYIVRLQRKKSRLYKKKKANNCDENIQNYDAVSKELRKAVRRAKRKVEVKISKQSGNDGRKKFNAYVKKKLGNNFGTGPLMENNKIITDDLGMANILNNQFSSVFTTDQPNVNYVQPMTRAEVEEKLFEFVVTKNDISKRIDDMKNGKAPGPDGICTAVLKNLKNALLDPLQILFQLSLDTGQVPDDWKRAKVTPIFKKGSKGKASNYRPVSLTSLVCKLLEGIIREKLTDHLLRHNLLNGSQHGFMKNRSCQTNLLEFMDKILQLIDDGKPVDIFYLDFAKAFDRISHKKLIQKLELYGISGKIKNWIQEWLTNRKQWVCINGCQSEERDVTSGVPQGSVLGPLLFIIYIDDIDLEALAIDILRKFADDTKGAKVVLNQEDADIMQDCLNKLYEWGQVWNMDFNVAKCKIMHCGYNNKKFDYNINGVSLEKISSERDIGVCFTSNLKPSQQCQEAANKARSVLGQITRCFHYRDKVVFLRLYKQYVRTHLEFSSSVWSPWQQADVQILENVQKKAIGMISGLRSSVYEERLVELDLWTLEKRREMFDMIQVYKMANRIGNVQSSLIFNRDLNNSNRTTRNRSEPLNLVKQRSNLEIKRHFFSDRVVDKWNSIPSEIKKARDVKKFKNCIVKWMNEN